MTVYAIIDTKKGRTGIAPTYLHTTPEFFSLRHNSANPNNQPNFFRAIRICFQIADTGFTTTCFLIFLHHPGDRQRGFFLFSVACARML